MPPEEGFWMEMTEHSGENLKKNFFISVPKRIVKLATRRNRIKRLLREAVRQDPYFKRGGVIFEFKVTAAPKKPVFAQVKRLVEKLKKAC